MGKNPDGIFPDDLDMVRPRSSSSLVPITCRSHARNAKCPNPQDHHRHRSRPGRRRRHPAGARQPGTGDPRHHRRCRQRAAEADREECPQDLRTGRPAGHQGLCRRHPAAGAPAGHRRASAWQDRPRRPGTARADDAAAGAACRRLHRRDADARASRHGHAVPARAADQHRAGADPRAADRAAHQGNRADGRRLLRGRQRHAGGRIQHLCRSAGRRCGVPAPACRS